MKQEEMSPADLAKLTVLYTIPGVESVTVRRDETYRTTEAGPLTMDVYYPPGPPSLAERATARPAEALAKAGAAEGSRLPAVLIVYGYSDAGFPNVFGRTFKEMGATVSWARLIAASGMVAILYSNREPLEDVESVLEYIREHAASLGIDESFVGLWAGSANVPLALWLLMQKGRDYIKCAVLCYGFMLDVDGATGVAEIQKTYHFANASAGKHVDDVRNDVPLLVARSGKDQFPGLNESLDNFVRGALRCNLRMTLVNHADAPHGFDLFHDSDTTREIIRQILTFLRFHLVGPVLSDRPEKGSNE